MRFGTYGADRELKPKGVRKASGLDTWTYECAGSRHGVDAKPTTYTYLVDGQGRRVGKVKVGTSAETVKKRWLYREGMAPVAELDSSGT